MFYGTKLLNKDKNAVNCAIHLKKGMETVKKFQEDYSTLPREEEDCGARRCSLHAKILISYHKTYIL